MASTDRRHAVPSELGVAALVVAASLPLGRLFRTGSILSTAIAATVAATAVAWGLRRLRAPTLVSALGSIVAFLWFASFAFFPESMFGPFPTPRTLSLVWDTMFDAIRRSQTDAAPVAASTAFLCLSSFAVWATAWLADDAAIKLRHPMLAIGVTVPLYVLPGTILEGTNRWADAGLYLSAALWVLFQDERYRLSRWGRVVGTGVPGWRPGLAVRMGLVAIALALIATPVLPGFGAPPGLRGVAGDGGSRTTFNPLVSIRPQLGSPRPRDVFTVRTRFNAYMRLTALDRFDGFTWTSGPQTPTMALSGRSIAPQNPASTTRVVQDVEILTLSGPWLPAAYEPVRVDGLRGAGADPRSRTVISPTDLRRGLRYQVTSRVPRLTYDELDLAPFATDPSLRPYEALPPGLGTQRVAQIARRVVALAGAADAGPFRQAVALQAHLRTFSYNENVALSHDIADIVDFLENVRTGYCEQFATAMAVMARTLGLPARVAIGFAGGTPSSSPDEFTVTSRNAHAWVEIWLQGYGWVQFEPTPRSDSVVVPSYTSRATFAPPASPTPTPEETTEPSPTSSAEPRAGIDPEIEGAGRGAVGSALLVTGIVVGGLLLLAALAFPIAGSVRRRIRHRGAHAPHDRVAVRYLDFLDWCAATGNGRAPGETPIEHARRLAEASSESPGSMRALAAMAVDATYAPPNGIDVADAIKLARDAKADVASTLPRRTRILTRLGWGWWRSDPASRPSSRLRPAETRVGTFRR